MFEAVHGRIQRLAGWRTEIDTTQPKDARLVDNLAEHRYELWVGDERVGTIRYDTLPEAIVLIHTEVDPAFEGKGFGSRLVHDALAEVRSRGLKVVPRCAFVRSYLGRHPEEADVLKDRAEPSDSEVIEMKDEPSP
jgi:predicted GNAT family acetyltransferase